MIKKVEKITQDEIKSIAPGATVTYVLPNINAVLSANSYLSRLRMLKPNPEVETYKMETCRDTTTINITAIGYANVD